MSRARGAMGKFLNSLTRSIYPIILFSLWVFFACGTSCVRIFCFFSPCELAAGAFSPPLASQGPLFLAERRYSASFLITRTKAFSLNHFSDYSTPSKVWKEAKRCFSRYDNILLSAASLTFEVCNNHIYLCTCTANLQYFCNISYYIALSTNHFVL